MMRSESVKHWNGFETMAIEVEAARSLQRVNFGTHHVTTYGLIIDRRCARRCARAQTSRPSSVLRWFYIQLIYVTGIDSQNSVIKSVLSHLNTVNSAPALHGVKNG